MKFLKVSICALLISSARSMFFTPVVEIEQGLLRGIRAFSSINQYLGIQYATTERFQPPREPKRWRGIYNAVHPLKMCAQWDNLFYIFGTNEDCLYLDVFTPKNAKRGDKLPVVVFIHGGGFNIGRKGIYYNPEFVVTKNIVFVNINYRLGVLGFLCVNGIANLGIKDQIAALKWVQKNIAAFGGDPDHVTLAGQSAGSTMASMHMLSEQSAGLFHKAILISGFALVPWAFNADPLTTSLKDANKISVARTEEEIYNVFAMAPIHELIIATRAESFNSYNFKYSPCVDSHLPDPFFRDTPSEIIKSGNFNKVPVLMGVTSREGITFYGCNNKASLAEWNADFADRVPAVFSCSKDVREKIGQKMRAYYFGKQPINEDAKQSIVNYYSDWIVDATFDAFSQLLAHYSEEPVYKYVFSYDAGARNFNKIIFGRDGANLKGVAHSDDISYLFKYVPLPLLRVDKLIIDRYTTMMANFIKYSNPTPHPTPLLPVPWPVSTADASYIMHVDRQLKVTAGPWKKDRFFLNLLCQYGLKGYVPCESAQQCYSDDTHMLNSNHLL